MQSFGWYMRRLRAMSPGEVMWRGRATVRDHVDRYRVALGLVPGPMAGARLRPEAATPRGDSQVPIGAWADPSVADPFSSWRARLIARADAIVAHRFSFFDLDQVDVGTPVDWNRDHSQGIAAPRGFSASIDYRDHEVTGDAKVVWEPNRHHHLVVLARAYRATGQARYADAVAEQMVSWMDQCPFGTGMNWRSPLELAIRVINWTWSIGLLDGARVLEPALQERVLHSIRLHVWDIARKYSRGSSANNHLIGEACGVFVATSRLPQLPDAERLRAASQAILEREMLAQTFPSGATREQAFGYHLFVLQFFVCAGLVARSSDRDFTPAYWARLERMFEFAVALSEGGPPPSFGDADDGYVLDLGDSPRDAVALEGLAARLFESSSFRPTPSETAYWLFGLDRFHAVVSSGGETRALQSRAFADTGCYLLQWGLPGDADRVSVLFDAGELGFGTLAAHGHADALSFTLRAFGADVFVDPGTYDYFTYPRWRAYFRSTQAHSTVTIDGEDQSVPLGLFLWGRRATARCLDWLPRPGGGRVVGEHDGYTRLTDPVVCRRTLDLDCSTRTLVIEDEILASGRHDIALYFHLSESCEARRDGQTVSIDFGAGRTVLRLDERLRVDMVKGDGASCAGWLSRGYHQKTPVWTIRARMTGNGRQVLRSVIELDPPR